MKTEQILQLMNAIPPDMVEEADIPLPAKQPMLKIARAGLIAACLCLALVGVGAAAVARGWINASEPTVTVLPHRDGGTVSITEYKITEDGSVYIPLEAFSQEALDYASSFMRLPQNKSFDSWQAAEDFLGVHLGMDNPVLDKAQLLTQPATSSENYSSYYESDLPGYQAPPSMFTQDAANCLVTFSGHPDHPSCISLYSVYRLDALDGTPFNLCLTANIFTFARSSDYQPGSHYAYNSEIAVENYTTPSGLQAVIVTNYLPEFYAAWYQVRFLLNGAHYDMLVNFDYGETGHWENDHWEVDDVDADAVALPVIKEVLDGFSG